LHKQARHLVYIILVFYFTFPLSSVNIHTKYIHCKQWRAEGGDGERGDSPGHPRQGGIKRGKLHNCKCCA